MLIPAKWSQRLIVAERTHLEERSSDSDLCLTAKYWILLKPAYLYVNRLTEHLQDTKTH